MLAEPHWGCLQFIVRVLAFVMHIMRWQICQVHKCLAIKIGDTWGSAICASLRKHFYLLTLQARASHRKL